MGYWLEKRIRRFSGVVEMFCILICMVVTLDGTLKICHVLLYVKYTSIQKEYNLKNCLKTPKFWKTDGGRGISIRYSAELFAVHFHIVVLVSKIHTGMSTFSPSFSLIAPPMSPSASVSLATCCSSNKPDMSSSQGLCTCCSLHWELSSPRVWLAPSHPQFYFSSLLSLPPDTVPMALLIVSLFC